MDVTKIKPYYTKDDPLVVYKMVKYNGDAPWVPGFGWDLPKNGKRGKTHSVPPHMPVVPCLRGIHGCPDLLSLLQYCLMQSAAARLFVAELWGEVLPHRNTKVAARHGRLCYEIKAWDASDFHNDILDAYAQRLMDLATLKELATKWDAIFRAGQQQ